MHLTLKKEATRPPGMNALQQQARFDDFVNEFNSERPHEALAMKRPADIYAPSSRPYDGLPDLAYPLHDRDVLVTACGRICMHRKRVNISTALAGQRLGIKEVDEGIWLVSFMSYDLGFIDLEQKTLQPLDNPFGPRLSPMSQVRSVTHVSGLDRECVAGAGGFEPPHGGIKIRCLTAWRRPKTRAANRCGGRTIKREAVHRNHASQPRSPPVFPGATRSLGLSIRPPAPRRLITPGEKPEHEAGRRPG